jgi:hypothetical protein
MTTATFSPKTPLQPPLMADRRRAAAPVTTQPPHTFIPRDCQVARFSRTNLLMIGSKARIEGLVHALWSRDSLSTWRPGQALTLPEARADRAGGKATVILHEVGELPREDQQRLSRWLEAEPGRTHVVCTSASPLHLRVAAGAFLDTLYYRLNTICVEMAD